MAHTGREIYEAAQARGIPCYPANKVSQAITSEQVIARRFLREMEVEPGRVAGFPGLPFPIRGRSPAPANAGAAPGRAHQYPVVGASGIHRPGACQAQGDGGHLSSREDGRVDRRPPPWRACGWWDFGQAVAVPFATQIAGPGWGAEVILVETHQRLGNREWAPPFAEDVRGTQTVRDFSTHITEAS